MRARAAVVRGRLNEPPAAARAQVRGTRLIRPDMTRPTADPPLARSPPGLPSERPPAKLAASEETCSKT